MGPPKVGHWVAMNTLKIICYAVFSLATRPVDPKSNPTRAHWRPALISTYALWINTNWKIKPCRELSANCLLLAINTVLVNSQDKERQCLKSDPVTGVNSHSVTKWPALMNQLSLSSVGRVRGSKKSSWLPPTVQERQNISSQTQMSLGKVGFHI